MSLPRYPEYKDSGVEWLGEVPGHWEIKRLKYIANFCGGGTPSRDDPIYWNGDIPWVSPKDMKVEIISDSEERITQMGLQSSATSLVDPGAVLIVVRSGILKHTIPVAINSRRVSLNQDMKAVLFDCASCMPRFFMRWIQGLNDSLLLAWSKQGATVESIEHNYLVDTVVPLPPVKEQACITAFLDRETAKIDALIAEQEKLIALLAEKRQATISHAVTRGLDPDAPMKDSGVAWLGEVPAHWKVGKAGFYISVLPGYAFPSTGFSLDDSNVRLLRGINVGVGELRWDEVVYWQRTENDGLEAFELQTGDVVIGMDRPLISTGMRVALVKEDDLPCLLLQRVAKVQPGALVDGQFIMQLLSSRAFEAHFAPETTGVSVPHISAEQISSFVIPVPPLDEQRRICDYVEAELERLDALNREAGLAITLLKERRSALIAAAVTGQIDVRGAVAEGDPQRISSST